MKTAKCVHADEVLEAARSQALSVGQQRHVDECAACREIALVASWVQTGARKAAASALLPDAETIWWRSQVVRQLCEKEDRIDSRTKPLVFVQAASVLVAVVTATTLVFTSEAVISTLNGVAAATGGSGGLAGLPAALLVAAMLSLGVGGFLAWRVSADMI